MSARRESAFSNIIRIHSTKSNEDPTSSSEDVGQVTLSADSSEISAQVTNDGRVDVKLNHKAWRLTKQLEKARQINFPLGQRLTKNNRKDDSDFQAVLGKFEGIPKLNIAIQIVGSRGDVQPFIGIGQILQREPYGHRVRICTHPIFKDFVEEHGLEFFSIGGDPATLMAYMVKNPGLMPGRESWKAGDVGKRRADIAEILEGCWRGCIESGNGMGQERNSAEDSDKEPSTPELTDCCFIADAIIANPPSYGHIHCAEKLRIPLHMMFTMPWSPTQSFPHPLASVERNESDPSITNYISYTLMELLAWQGLGDVINGFRLRTLHLDAISPLWGHMLLSRMKVPFTYAWSSSLIPKPPDWGSYINICGFSFLKTPDTYKPPEDLVAFLEAGPPPVYIGFGSIVVDHPVQLTKMIFGAVKRAGVRALVSKGWGGLGGEDPPEGIFLLGNVPHDWLFKYVSCVVHHGGAGTSAIGIAMGKPTVVVPFFGDQPFWGAMIYRAEAGPEPVPFKKMTEHKLAESITRALQPDIQTAVKIMSERIAGENGAAEAAKDFHKMLNYDSMRCLMCPDKVAVWRIRRTRIRLSALAAATLINNKCFKLEHLKLIKHRDWYMDEGAPDPIAGVIATVSGAVTNTILSISSYSHDLNKTVHKHPTLPTVSGSSSTISSNPIKPASPLPYSAEVGVIQSRVALDEVATYPPDHLEMIAYKMASEKLPNTASRSRGMKKHSWTPTQSKRFYTADLAPSHHKTKQGHSKAYEAAADTGHFAEAMLRTGLSAPVNFFYNLANGFYNTPSYIFHDETVHRRDTITGFRSGLKVAAKGFTYNIFAGFTGILTQPYLGYEREGGIGFLKGVGKGVGGIPFKIVAAGLGIPGYTLKGIEKQLEKRLDRGLKAGILEVRLRQGLIAYGRASREEKDDILRRWKELGLQGGGLGL